MDIITDPSRSCKTDPDVTLGSNTGWDVTMALVVPQLTHFSMAPAAARPSDTDMASSDCPDPGWRQEPQSSTQTLTAALPVTKT